MPHQAEAPLQIPIRRFDSALSIDFRALSDLKVQNIEKIDLSSDGGNSSLDLNLTDVLNFSGLTNQLTIEGASGDTVDLHASSNGATGSWSLAGNAAGFDTFEFSNGSVLATVIIDENITTSVF